MEINHSKVDLSLYEDLINSVFEETTYIFSPSGYFIRPDEKLYKIWKLAIWYWLVVFDLWLKGLSPILSVCPSPANAALPKMGTLYPARGSSDGQFPLPLMRLLGSDLHQFCSWHKTEERKGVGKLQKCLSPSPSNPPLLQLPHTHSSPSTSIPAAALSVPVGTAGAGNS